jgi:PAS domain S-box-containing protein
MGELGRQPNHLDAAEAARYLDVTEAALSALVAAGYLLPPAEDGFSAADLKAFMARNADNGSGYMPDLFDAASEPADPQALLEALDGRSEDMARRAFDIFVAAFPEARQWSLSEQARFIDQARNRFEAILAVTGQGAAVDEALVGDLQDVGAAAAWAGSPLPHLLAILRISRDLVVQTAVELAEERGGHWGLTLSLLLTRVLPAMDRLTDALAQGYWAAVVGREEDLRDRYQHLVETSSNGVFEVDLDGRIQYANPSLGEILGRSGDALEGAPLRDVIVPADPSVSVEPLMADAPSGEFQLTVVRADGARRELDVSTSARYKLEELLGFQGVVRDVTAERDLERDKAEFLALVTKDLRSPLANLLAQGANLEANAGELPSDQVARMGGAIRTQAERISRLAEDLYDISRLSASRITLSSRPVELASVVRTALASVVGPGEVAPEPDDVVVNILAGIEVMADPRRLEQVIANLVENGLINGEPPVEVTLQRASGGDVEVTVSDQRPGDASPTRGTGLRLALVRGLIEGMGGTVAYEGAGGPTFRITLPQPRPR